LGNESCNYRDRKELGAAFGRKVKSKNLKVKSDSSRFADFRRAEKCTQGAETFSIYGAKIAKEEIES